MFPIKTEHFTGGSGPPADEAATAADNRRRGGLFRGGFLRGGPTRPAKIPPAAPGLVPAFFILSLLLLLPMLRDGYIVDDTYIHLQFARNLAAGEGWCFNRGEPVYGFTGPLFPALLAALHAAAGIGFENAARAVAVSSILASLSLLFYIGRRLLPRGIATAVLLLAFATDPWILRWTASGMETAPTLPFLLGSTALLLAAAPPGWKRIFAAGACAGFGALSRPETMLFGVVVGASLLLPGAGEKARRTAGRGIAWSAGLASVLLPWHLYAWRVLGRALPTTFAAKGGAFPPATDRILISLERTAAGFGPRVIDGFLLLIIAVTIIITLFKQSDYKKHLKKWFKGSPRESVPLRGQVILAAVAWALLLPLFYISRGAVPLSRYLVPAFPYLILSCLLAVDLFSRSESKAPEAAKSSSEAPSAPHAGKAGGNLAVKGFSIFAGFATTLASVNLVLLYLVVYPHVAAFSEDYEDAVVGTAIWLAGNSPPNAVVATRDIGGIGYFSRRRICDLGGLVTPEMLTLRDDDSLDAVISRGVFPCSPSPGYLVRVVPMSCPPITPSESPLRFTMLRSSTIRQQGLSFSEPTAYRLYSIDGAAAR